MIVRYVFFTHVVFGLFAIGLALLLFGVWMVGWIPTYAAYCEYNPNTEHEKCATYEVSIVAIRYVGWFLDSISPALTAIATAAIGLFTYTLYTATAGMLRTTNSAIGLARDEFNSTHRPQIRIKHVWLQGHIDIYEGRFAPTGDDDYEYEF